MIRAALALALIACGQHERPSQLYLMADPVAFDHTKEVISAVNEAAEKPLIVLGVKVGETTYIRERCGEQQGNEILIGPCGTCGAMNVGSSLVLVHEIGHRFGLPDSPNPDSVMFQRFRTMTLAEAARSLVEELNR